MNWQTDLENPTPKAGLKWAAILMVAIIFLSILGSWLGVFGSVATAPSRVINETMKTDNIIQSYEWFFDVDAAYQARVGQITAHSNLISTTPVDDRKELRNLRIELVSMQQSCRDLVTKYNANSQKMNKKIFKGWDLPPVLDIATCN